MRRAYFLRRLPLLLLAVALVASSVMLVHDSRPAQAQTTVWSATLTVTDLDGTSFGCIDIIATIACAPEAKLTDDDFTYDGEDYGITAVYAGAGHLFLRLDKTILSSLKSALTLTVDGARFPLADAAFQTVTATNDQVFWTSPGLSWTANQRVSLSLMDPTGPPAVDWSDTLTAKAVDYGFGCGFRSGQPQCSDALPNRVIVYNGADYTVELVHVAYSGGTLQFILDKELPARLQARGLALEVSGRQFAVKDAMVSYGIGDGSQWTNTNAWVLTWTGTGMDWSENQRISLKLVTRVGGL